MSLGHGLYLLHENIYVQICFCDKFDHYLSPLNDKNMFYNNTLLLNERQCVLHCIDNPYIDHLSCLP